MVAAASTLKITQKLIAARTPFASKLVSYVFSPADPISILDLLLTFHKEWNNL